MLRDGSESRKWVFAEYNGRGFVRNHRWKLYSDGKFYEVAADPDEKSPLTISQLSTDARRAHHELKVALDELGYEKKKSAQ